MEIQIIDKLLKISDGNSIESANRYLRTDDVTKVAVEKDNTTNAYSLIFSNGDKYLLSNEAYQYIFKLNDVVVESGLDDDNAVIEITTAELIGKLLDAQKQVNLFFLTKVRTLPAGTISIFLKAGTRINGIIVEGEEGLENYNISCGTTNGGKQIMEEVPVINGLGEFNITMYFRSDTTLYFSNVDETSIIKIYTL